MFLNRKQARRAFLVFCFVYLMTLAAGLVAIITASYANAAEVADPWPFPKVVTIAGTVGLPCPAGYTPTYTGERIGRLSWLRVPQDGQPVPFLAPARICLDKNGGQPFGEGWAVLAGEDAPQPCTLCVLGRLPVNE